MNIDVINDFVNNEIVYVEKKQKMGKKRIRDAKYKEHLKFLQKNIHSYPPPTTNYMYNKESGIYEESDRIKRIYRGNHKGNRYKYYKRYGNKKVRRYKGKISNGGMYKKVSEFWWMVD